MSNANAAYGTPHPNANSNHLHPNLNINLTPPPAYAFLPPHHSPSSSSPPSQPFQGYLPVPPQAPFAIPYPYPCPSPTPYPHPHPGHHHRQAYPYPVPQDYPHLTTPFGPTPLSTAHPLLPYAYYDSQPAADARARWRFVSALGLAVGIYLMLGFTVGLEIIGEVGRGWGVDGEWASRMM